MRRAGICYLKEEIGLAVDRELVRDDQAPPGVVAGQAARRVLLPLVVMALVTLGLGLLITRVLGHSALIAGDEAFSREVAQERTPFWNQLTHYGSMLSDTPVIIVLTAVAVIVFRLVFRRWREGVFLVLGVCAQSAIFLLATVFAQRPRPHVPHLDPAPPTSSYPSGHTSAAVAFYCGVALVLTLHTYRHAILNAVWWLLGAGAPLTVGASRIYRGMHHLTDVGWGLVLGVFCLVVVGQAILLRPIPALSWRARRTPVVESPRAGAAAR
ncbi:phosphatase PAP2 family protein [Microbispora sp. ATCC PTA-5024]|uniref:phosphatase PAP2 family protein n=1 Tax=Microbispora sp. ATCC PTA-5024 TaxID=316330 RepID=UPI0003DCB211|nr:phosphatase PAP2 family protein [Microbispora sp. ATCC PTA-5024]ETK32722.1 phospholipid phosphatase [Microbispora sp. ATCC PTA-5024]